MKVLFIGKEPYIYNTTFYDFVNSHTEATVIAAYYDLPETPHSDTTSSLTIQEAKTEILKGSFDLVVINDDQKVKKTLSLAGWCQGKKVKVAIRLTTATLQQEPLTTRVIKHLIHKQHLKRSDHLFVCGKDSTRYLETKNVDEQEYSLLPYMPDVAYFQKNGRLKVQKRRLLKQKLGIAKEKKVIFSMPLHTQGDSDLITLLIALTTLEKREQICLLLAGTDSIMQIVNQYASLEIKLIDTPDYIDLPAYYGMSDLFIHTGISADWYVPMAEALAAGIPAIDNDHSTICHDLLIPGETGFIYPVGNHALLAEQLKIALFHFNTEDVATKNNQKLSAWNYDKLSETLIATTKKLNQKRG